MIFAILFALFNIENMRDDNHETVHWIFPHFHSNK